MRITQQLAVASACERTVWKRFHGRQTLKGCENNPGSIKGSAGHVGWPAFNDGAHARVGVLDYELEVMQTRDCRDNAKAQPGARSPTVALGAVKALQDCCSLVGRYAWTVVLNDELRACGIPSGPDLNS